MAGPYTGTWVANAVSQAEYTTASKWGTGINPVHSIRGEGPFIAQHSKVNFPPPSTPGGQETDAIAEDFAWDNTYNPDPTLESYNITPATLWGNNEETGLADRPEWDQTMADSHANEAGYGLPNPQVSGPPITVMRGRTQNDTGNPFPQWFDGSKPTRPGGTVLRAIRRGAQMISSARVLPSQDVAQGWTNKNTGIAADSVPSDPSQLVMQTSQTQRYQFREGSQRAGSQSTQEARIDSRVVGQKLKTWSRADSARHWDMLPYEQQDFVRPFLSRQAGTGWREWNLPNEMTINPVIQREPAADPYLGPVAGTEDVEPIYDYGVGYA